MEAKHDFIPMLIDPYNPSVLFVGHRQTTADPDQTQQNGASDQGLHCLLTECSIKNLVKMKEVPPNKL